MDADNGVTVKFFSLLREALDCEERIVALTPDVTTVRALRQQLIAEGGPEWEETLTQPRILIAVNQVVVTADHRLTKGDEVAFFPPMTGG